MIREIKTNRIPTFDPHSMNQPPRQIFNPTLHLSKRNLLSRRTIDERDPIRTFGRRIVASLFSVKHERVDVCVGDIGNIPKGSLDDMTWVDLDVCHGGSRVKKEAVGSEAWRQKKRLICSEAGLASFPGNENNAVRSCESGNLTQFDPRGIPASQEDLDRLVA